jgi:transposase
MSPPPGRVLPQRAEEARCHPREKVVAAEPLEEPGKNQRGLLNQVFHLNRRVFKAYLLKESLEKLWGYRYEGAMLNYLHKWIDQLRWQRLPSFQKLADMLLKHLQGILNYCRVKVRFGVVEAINGNIRMLINRGRGYKNMRYLLLKARRMAVTNTEYVAFQKIRKAA